MQTRTWTFLMAAVSTFMLVSLAYGQSGAGDQRSRSSDEGWQFDLGDDEAREQRDAQRQREGRQAQRQGARQDRRAALTHYLAGYYSGYREGYRDASDDTVWYIVDLQQQRRAQRGQQEQGQVSRRSDARQTEQERLRSRLRAAMRAEQRGSGEQSRQQTISGQILRTKEVELRGADTKHLVAQVRTEQGRTPIVDLGPTPKLRRLDLNRGDRITVRGRVIRVGDKRVVKAQQVRSGGETVSVRTVRPQQQRQRDQLLTTRRFGE